MGEPQIWALRYERPVAEQGLVWITEVAFERDESLLRGQARLYQRSLSTARPRFERIVLRPPGFVFSLRNRGLLGLGRFVVRTITRESVGAFVEEVVDPHRAVPIVAISVDPYSEETLLNSSSLQDELVGIAQVVELAKTASFLLPGEFAKRGVPPIYARVWGVYGGAVKVYRVRAQVSETPFDHPIWLPVDVTDQGFAATLKDWCWSLAALEPAYLGIDVAAIRGAKRLAIEPPAASTVSVDELTELYQSCLAEEQTRTTEQRQRAEGEKARADELAAKVQQLESKVQSLQFQLSRKLQVPPAAAEEPAPTDFANVNAALDRARRDFAATLIIPTDVEVETSEAPEYWYGALHALHRLCELERRGEATNKRAQLRDLLKKHVGASKDTYKIADTGVSVINPMTARSWRFVSASTSVRVSPMRRRASTGIPSGIRNRPTAILLRG